MALTWSYALRFIAGRYKGGEFPLRPNREIVIGRGSEFDMVLEEDMVSRRHARISTFHGRIVFEDLGSTNGSFVNGQKLEGRAQLNAGDQLLVGSSLMELVSGDSSGVSRPLRISSAPMPLSVPPAQQATTDGMPAQLFGLAGGLAGGPAALRPTLTSPAAPTAEAPIANRPTLNASPTRGMPRAPTPTPATVDQRTAGMRGRFPEDGASLTEVLTLLHGTHRTGVLVVTDPSGNEGRAYLRDGEVFFATVWTADGTAPVGAEKALFRVLAWTSGTFTFENQIASPVVEGALEPGTPARLLAAAAHNDTLAQYAGHLPAASAHLGLPQPLEARLSGLSAEALDTLQVVLNHGQVGRVLDHSAATDLETWQDLLYLMQNGYLVTL